MPNGRVTDYAEDMQMGVIKTPDEKRFIFGKPDWASPHVGPTVGLDVSFDTAGPSAKKITIVEPGKS
jgi:hypothetical protein